MKISTPIWNTHAIDIYSIALIGIDQMTTIKLKCFVKKNRSNFDCVAGKEEDKK